MSASKDKGTKAETEVVKLAVKMGWPYCERRSLQGGADRGDITGIPGVTIEVKAEKKPSLGVYFRETLTESANDGWALPVLVVKKPYKNVKQWDAYIPLVVLMGNIEYILWDKPEEVRWARLDLEDMFWYLKELDY